MHSDSRNTEEQGPRPVDRAELSSGATRPLMIAHRCGAGLGPENTRSAVAQASFYRPDFYEIDIHHTLDGVPVCIHDDTLDRTTDLSGKISEMNLSQVQSADAGSWLDADLFEGEKIPTFKEILDSVNPSPLAIELKEAGMTEEQCAAMAEALKNAGDESSVIFSFHRAVLDNWRSVDPDRRTCFLTLMPSDYMLEGPHEIVGLLYGMCTPELVDEVHDAGKVIWVWTVDDEYEKYMLMGVDGIITNYPDRLREVLPPS